MRKDDVLKFLTEHKPGLVSRFGVTDLALFGSMARDEAQEGSDVVHNLLLIGEAATHVPKHVRVFADDIDWRQIIGTRNRLIHGYLGIKNGFSGILFKIKSPC